MTLLPGWKLRTLAAIVASLFVVTAVSAGARTSGAPRYAKQTKRDLREGAASGPREVEGGARKVGEERVRHVVLPGPVKAASGGVYVPTALKQLAVDEIDYHVQDDPSEDIRGGAMGSRGASPDRSSVVSPNVRANDTALDPAGSCQSETAITAFGANLVTAWNDGTNFSVSPGATGFAYSTNGGLTWTDGGVPPVTTPVARHEGDAGLANDGAGNYYLSDLYTPDNTITSAIAVTRGTFAGPVLTFGLPVMPASSITDFLDKPWIAADPGTGNVYCTWTRFFAAGGNQIEFSRSTTLGATWDPPVAISNPGIENCQGSRVAVGPTGEIQVIYFVYDYATGNNYMRTRRSTTFGVSWGAEVTLPTGLSGVLSNYGSGPAGFNRNRGIGFPSLAIDRTAGANSGHVYATWEETVNYYTDPLGTLVPIAETEANGGPATANPITIGQQVNGTMASGADQDWFSFTGVAGQTVIIYMVPSGVTPGDGFLRLFCGGGAAANRAMFSYLGSGQALVVYTPPSNGTYYFRVLDASGASSGSYTVYTGLDIPNPGDEVGRDTRDAIIQSSPDGVVWDVRRVVNNDAALYDNTFPEVAVDAASQVYVDWYDHRGDPCGIGTDIYYARSSNASVSFFPSIKVNDGPPINWSLVSSNLQPNMGDYSTLVADGCNVYANFADGRQGTPDSWVATINDCATPTVIALTHAMAEPDHVDLGWYASDAAELVATVYRREQGGEWSEIGTTRSDGSGQISFRDAAVRAGTRYGYRLGINGDAGVEYFGEVWVDVPTELGLAIRALSNPVTEDFTVSFSLPSGAPGTLELLDVAGRSIESVKVNASGRARLGGPGLAAGVYVVKLTQAGRSVTTRTVVVR